MPAPGRRAGAGGGARRPARGESRPWRGGRARLRPPGRRAAPAGEGRLAQGLLAGIPPDACPSPLTHAPDASAGWKLSTLRDRRRQIREAWTQTCPPGMPAVHASRHRPNQPRSLDENRAGPEGAEAAKGCGSGLRPAGVGGAGHLTRSPPRPSDPLPAQPRSPPGPSRDASQRDGIGRTSQLFARATGKRVRSTCGIPTDNGGEPVADVIRRQIAEERIGGRRLGRHVEHDPAPASSLPTRRPRSLA